MLDKNIEDLVREYVAFNHGLNPKGWNRAYCEVCGDGSRTKGPRGGWLFTGSMCFYHCFNCGVDGNFDPGRQHPFGKDMVKIFDGFGIPSKEYFAIAYAQRIAEGNNGFKKPERKIYDIPVIPIPEFFMKLSDAPEENIFAQQAYKELEYRNVDPTKYTFYLSNGKSKGSPKDEAIAKALMGRLIIPFFNTAGEMIYYQAFDLSRKSKMKYINAEVPRTSVLYGMDRLHTNINNPLYVCEGFFDAFHLNGVSVQENSLSTTQISLLKKSPRRKVWVPDRKSDSSKAVDQFIKEGWEVSVPEFSSKCKDVDDAIRTHGKLYTVSQVSSNIYNGKDAKILMKLNGYLVK